MTDTWQGGGRALAVPCDASEAGDARGAVEAAVARFGALHILASNAAFFPPTCALPELDEATRLKTFAVNVHGSYYLCRHAIPAIADAGGGSIVLTA
jgi:NAD(P)-dependent dehydrogenase (short-subunit alcohol dehydrogenase family)